MTVQINSLTAPQVGDAATYSIMSDSYPAVVTAVSPSGKTVWVKLVNAIQVESNHVGHGHEATETILDPEGVEAALANPKNGAKKFMLRNENSRIRNGRESDEHGLPVGTPVIRQRWSAGKGVRAGVAFGVAITKQDPHV